jgi:ATP-dependent DNA ligase
LADSLWRQHVENGTCEGLVYKRIGDTYIDSTVWRRKKEVTMDYIMMGVYEGAGKHKGRLGGINGGLWVNGKAEIRCKVGGGFNDAEREDIWNNPQKYMGRVLEVKGWQLFESGAVRHPNAVRDERTGQLRWRDDKEQKDCYWAE